MQCINMQIITFLLLLFYLLTTGNSTPCSATNRLALKFLNQTTHPEARCADGTNSGYYLGRLISEEEDPADPDSFIPRNYFIWLGDVDGCSGDDCDEICEGSDREATGQGVCEGVNEELFVTNAGDELEEEAARCLFSRATCTSSWWDVFESSIHSELLFGFLAWKWCRRSYFILYFYCIASDTKFRGSIIFQNVISALIEEENLLNASKIVIGGTRYAGVAAIHHTSTLKSALDAALPDNEIDIYTIVDSGWTNNVENIATGNFSVNEDLRAQTVDWIQDATLISSCRDFWGDNFLYKCLFADELIRNHLTDLNYKILFLQSVYDLIALEGLGIEDLEIGDSSADALAEAGISFVETFGQTTRNSLQSMSRTLAETSGNNIFKFWSPSCGQTGFVVPTRIHSIDPTRQTFGSGRNELGSLLFIRDETVFSEITVNGMSAQDTVTLFVTSNGESITFSTGEDMEQLINQTAIHSGYRRVHLMAENLSYFVVAKDGKKVQILKDVSLAFNPGEVHAIMGPSGLLLFFLTYLGSGKSTLLELLAFSRHEGTMRGNIHLNGVNLFTEKANFLRTWLSLNTAYVAQADYFFPTLTVRETLEHAAYLILPEYVSDDDKLLRVYQLLELLDLSSCKDTLCGDGGVTIEGGISGGQRRRLSVAVQLLLNPSAILLDEPTSGLDSVSALNLVKRLRMFAERSGMNVILSIHQPRKEILLELHRISLLVLGEVVFSGRLHDAASFLGVNQDTLGNALLDQFVSVTDRNDPSLVAFKQNFQSSQIGQELRQSMESEKTNLSDELTEEMKELLIYNSIAEGRYSYSAPSSVLYLQWVLISRSITRGGLRLGVTMSLSFAGGVVLGGLFFMADSYDQLTGLIYLTVATITFIQGVFLGRRYFDEKLMYDYEYAAGTLKSWPAFLVAQFVKDGTTTLLECLSFGIPVYLIAGLELNVERALVFAVLISLIGLATTALNVLIQIDRDNVRAAGTLQVGFVALGALFNGFIIPLDALPSYYSWLPYTMPAFYGLVGVVVNQFSGFELPCDATVLECLTRTGDVIIRALRYDDLDIFICVLLLLILFFLFRVLSIIDFFTRYVGVKSLKVEKREVTENQNVVPVPSRANSEFRTTNPVGVGGTMGDMLNQNKDKFKKQKSSVFGRENLNDDEDSVSSKKKELNTVGIQAILLSRNLFALFFFIDLVSTPYICFEDAESVISILGLAFLGGYVLQFFNQISHLSPYTVGEEVSDFAWAVEFDAPSFLFLIIDGALVAVSSSLLTGGELASGEKTAVALGIKFIRLLRVQLYWNKVSKSHSIRARSFLDQTKQLIEEHLQQKQSKDQYNPSRERGNTNREWVTSMRITSGKRFQGMQMQSRMRTSSTSHQNPSFTNRFSQGITALRQGNLNLNKGPPPGMGGGGQHNSRVFNQGAGWKLYTSQQTGRNFYYNEFTGETLDADQIQGGRAGSMKQSGVYSL
eukprot:augustus_masked-scaffold_1-processed-gene-7.41-mRNA-1 protein AED:0.41 eAED:0.41 QI:0/0/0/0.33/1/1/3/0/1461